MSDAAERCGVYPDMREERHRRLEFNTNAINILNSLEHMGYRVVTSGSFVASQANNNNKVWTAVSLLGTFLNQFEFQEKRQIFIQKEFVWTVHRKSNEML